MGEKTKIQWCDSTWNPWRGCHKVSPGCDNCYMHRDQRRYGRDPSVVVRSKTTFYDPHKWKEGRLIFVCSWSDFFIEEADRWRNDAWGMIRLERQHIYEILTKRPERIVDNVPPDWPLPNVWLGVTVEDREHGLPRMDILREIPSVVRFISCEPFLEDLGEVNLKGIDWVIVGGESGPKARKMEADWVRNLRDQCVRAGVSFFFKQWGEFNQEGERVGKKKAGRVLDGREWNEMPYENVSDRLAERMISPLPALQRRASGEQDTRPLRIALPDNSTKHDPGGRRDTADFLELADVCPWGYSPRAKEYFPKLHRYPGLRFPMMRFQDMPALAARGGIEAFIAPGVFVVEAIERGVQGIEHVLELPYASVDLAMLTEREAPFSSISELVSSVNPPIRCVSDLPFLARKVFLRHEDYIKRFGTLAPVIEAHGKIVTDGCEAVRISVPTSSPERLVGEGLYHCAFVTGKNGDVFKRCYVKEIRTMRSYSMAFFCRTGVRGDPVLAAYLDWYVGRLQVAKKSWESRPRLGMGEGLGGTYFDDVIEMMYDF
jgi:protein gp37